MPWIAVALAFVVSLFTVVNAADSDTLDLGAMMQPLSDAGIYREADYHTWCPNIVRGGDGRFYIIYSRWPKKTGDPGWLTDSEIAVAVADKPEGPYRHLQVLLKGAGPGHWDELMAHNPKLYVFGGKYYLYYISSRPGPTRGHIRDSQRIGVAVSDSIFGPYRRCERSLVEPAAPIYNVAVNPAVTATPDGGYLMIVKGDLLPKKPTERVGQRVQAVALADSPLGPFRLLPDPAIADIDTEDAAVWHDRKRGRFYAVFHAHTYIGLITSEDGLHWRRARHYEVTKKEIPRTDGTVLQPSRLERPDVYFENGKPRMFCAGAKVGRDYFCVLVSLGTK